jgi:hypothetical protein
MGQEFRTDPRLAGNGRINPTRTWTIDEDGWAEGFELRLTARGALPMFRATFGAALAPCGSA